MKEQISPTAITFAELSDALYEDLNGVIDRIENAADDAYTVWIECDDWNDHDRRRRFRLRFSGTVEMRCDTGWCGSIAQYERHCLLWNHSEPNVTLYFFYAPADPEAVLGRIYETHNRLFRHWREMHEYWHATSHMMRQGNGLLFRAPKPVAEAYRAALEGMLDCTPVSGGNSRMPVAGYTCYILENNFVIARAVKVTEVTGVPDGEREVLPGTARKTLV